MFGKRRKATAKAKQIGPTLWQVHLIPGGYYHAEFDGDEVRILTGAKRLPASTKMAEKLKPRMIAAIKTTGNMDD